MVAPFQFSAGELFELMRPAAYVITALLSAWAFGDSLRRRIPLLLAAAWALGTFLFPPVILPLYLIFRTVTRKRDEMNESPNIEGEIKSDGQKHEDDRETRRPWLLLPVAYVFLLLSLGALGYYMDYRSVDAHLARANHARVLMNRDRTISEYRAALALEDNAHTRDLLGIELLNAGRLQEALAELSAAERGGEPDPELPLYLGITLDALERHDEASDKFRKFLSGPLCTQPPPDLRCPGIEKRVRSEPARAN